MSQASLGLNSCFLYLTFELFDVWTWCPDMILTLYQKMVWAHWLILQIWLMRITTLLYWSILLILVAFLTSLDPSMPPGLFDFDTLIEDIWGEELALDITIRADGNFVDLHCFVEGPKFWKIVPHLFYFPLLCVLWFHRSG